MALIVVRLSIHLLICLLVCLLAFPSPHLSVAGFSFFHFVYQFVWWSVCSSINLCAVISFRETETILPPNEFLEIFSIPWNSLNNDALGRFKDVSRRPFLSGDGLFEWIIEFPSTELFILNPRTKLKRVADKERTKKPFSFQYSKCFLQLSDNWSVKVLAFIIFNSFN